VKVDDLINNTKEIEISSQIKSDSQLCITFHSLEGKKANDENENVFYMIEVLLYRFKQLSPEMLINNPTSLPFEWEVLGKCVIPNESLQIQKHSITIPSSVLSWKGVQGPLCTHTLAFRITKVANDLALLHFQPANGNKNNRKRKGDAALTPSERKRNGLTSHAAIRREDVTKEKEDHITQNGMHSCNHAQLARNSLLPHGKISEETKIITAPTKGIKRRRTRVDDGFKRSQTIPETDKQQTTEDYLPSEKQVIHNSTDSEKNHRKRARGDINEAVESGDEHFAKYPHLSPSLNNFDNKMYYAELVAFDSRQECLLLDGDYNIILRECTSNKDKAKNAADFDWNNVFGKCSLDDIMPPAEYQADENVSLKFSVLWSPGVPKAARNEDASSTRIDFVKLRKEYENLIASLSSQSSSESSLSNIASPSSSSLLPKPTVFNFLYNKNSLQQTEFKYNYVCPWCTLDCGQLYPMLKHMTLCHPRFVFTYSPIGDTASIDVKLNKAYGSGTSSTAHDPYEKMQENSIKRKKYPTRCEPTTSIIVRGKTKCLEKLSEFSHNKTVRRKRNKQRLFYHTHSCLPMIADEEKDSNDEEGVNQWLKVTSTRMVDDFIDVNEGEKSFMKIWNFFIMDHKIIADKQVSEICLLFAKNKKTELASNNVTYNFISHIIYMCDIGLISPTTLLKIIDILHSSPG
jgi:polycomb protein SUZ12